MGNVYEKKSKATNPATLDVGLKEYTQDHSEVMRPTFAGWLVALVSKSPDRRVNIKTTVVNKIWDNNIARRNCCTQ